VGRFPDSPQPRYALTDQHGRLVSSTDFRGQFQLIAFGYTFCPDVCPTSLAEMARALKLLGDDAEHVQPIFISVDPGRDKPAILGEYARFFHPRLLALSADPEVTRRTAELFRARYEIVPSESGDPERYIVDHTASIYLIGPNGEFITKFAYGLPDAEIAARLRNLIDGGDPG
jgi:protein SCO1/2